MNLSQRTRKLLPPLAVFGAIVGGWYALAYHSTTILLLVMARHSSFHHRISSLLVSTKSRWIE